MKHLEKRVTRKLKRLGRRRPGSQSRVCTFFSTTAPAFTVLPALSVLDRHTRCYMRLKLQRSAAAKPMHGFRTLSHLIPIEQSPLCYSPLSRLKKQTQYIFHPAITHTHTHTHCDTTD